MSSKPLPPFALGGSENRTTSCRFGAVSWPLSRSTHQAASSRVFIRTNATVSPFFPLVSSTFTKLTPANWPKNVVMVSVVLPGGNPMTKRLSDGIVGRSVRDVVICPLAAAALEDRSVRILIPRWTMPSVMRMACCASSGNLNRANAYPCPSGFPSQHTFTVVRPMSLKISLTDSSSVFARSPLTKTSRLSAGMFSGLSLPPLPLPSSGGGRSLSANFTVMQAPPTSYPFRFLTAAAACEGSPYLTNA
mmetsp:Transcript_79209/g.131032  ORF Transcript_79209/g.131032 Transcript_79209/m.131032 type:complete len:248 (+) Transcript_79209:429-1172(+)